jgi:hypothetical protein
MAKKFSELREKMSTEAKAESAILLREALVEMDEFKQPCFVSEPAPVQKIHSDTALTAMAGV